jgi:glycosyltransferase involved in cell wall biosynthesis
MRVIINQLQSLKQKTGIGHYTAELLRCLKPLTHDDQVDTYPTGFMEQMAKAGLRANRNLSGGSNARLLNRLRSGGVGLMRDSFQWLLNRQFRSVCGQGRYDVYHEPNYLPMPANCPTLATVHDLSVVLHPHWHPAERVKRFERHFPKALERCAHFLADTDSVRREMIEHLGVAPSRVTRVYMGIRSDLRRLPVAQVQHGLNELRLPAQYLLCLGTIEPRKNVMRLLKIYASLPEAFRSRWPLVLVGGWGWNAQDVARHLEDTARHEGVIHLGYVPDYHLATLYNGARALLFPTFYEGFGLPPLEMMACGGAVIASTADAVKETVGGKAHLLHPEDDDAWRQAIMRVTRDYDWWQALRKGAEEIARPYTWNQCAAQTLDVYREVGGKKKKTRKILRQLLTPQKAAG